MHAQSYPPHSHSCRASTSGHTRLCCRRRFRRQLAASCRCIMPLPHGRTAPPGPPAGPVPRGHLLPQRLPRPHLCRRHRLQHQLLGRRLRQPRAAGLQPLAAQPVPREQRGPHAAPQPRLHQRHRHAQRGVAQPQVRPPPPPSAAGGPRLGVGLLVVWQQWPAASASLGWARVGHGGQSVLWSCSSMQPRAVCGMAWPCGGGGDGMGVAAALRAGRSNNSKSRACCGLPVREYLGVDAQASACL